ncbi:universal stress protein [uncultured Nonlabens sp.]|uniref:universal stress protein n=1 Tax=uncultured Nonlabens sp. TaxID=859306 RepID=UPI0030D705DE|tara:strand:+ start:34174 stop:35022 length:849 start_codon:yes stop_codon:yes gene_type:complete
MASIIVPTDFSDNAYNALFYASRLIPSEVSKILLVHSYGDQLSEALSRLDTRVNDAIANEMRAEVYDQLEIVKHKIIRDCEGKTLIVEFYYGALPLNDIINDLIENVDVDFVVMGTKGASGLKEIFIGSQAVKVVKSISPIPLFLIPEKADFMLPKNIVYAADLRNDYQRNQFVLLKKIIKEHQSNFHLAHVYHPSKAAPGVELHYTNLKNRLQEVAYTTHWIASDKEIEETLTEFCETHHINLLVIRYHKYSFLKSILKTSFVEKASFHIELPLLILPDSI